MDEHHDRVVDLAKEWCGVDLSATSSLPPLLVGAAGRLRDVLAAWRLVEASALNGDFERVTQYVSEAQHAAAMFDDHCEEWFVFGEQAELNERLDAVRGARHAYEKAMAAARRDDEGCF